MSDVAKWKVHGPVKTLRKEAAEWDLNQQDWQPPQYFSLTTFRPDGTLSTGEHHNPDGSIAYSRWLYNDANQLAEYNFWLNDNPISRTVYFYDEAGRHTRTAQEGPDGTQTDTEICTYDHHGKKTKRTFLSRTGANVSYGMEGTDTSYSAPGATTMTTTYGDDNLPAIVVFEDASQNPITTITFTRDTAGRILKEDQQINKSSLFSEHLDNAPSDDRDRLAAMVQQLFSDGFSSQTYDYDTQGRLLQELRQMGTLGGERIVYRYDLHAEPIEQSSEHKSREASIGEDGAMHYISERADVNHTRFEYRYDTHGNWTERIVSSRPEHSSAFQRSNIERREITYHTAS